MQDYAITDTGRVRKHNQDCIYSSSAPVGELENLYLVADGMGGHRAGDFASRFLVESLVSYFENHREEMEPVERIRQAVADANRALYRESVVNSEHSGMGTTLVAATIRNRTIFAANVGDSRLYLFRNERLSQITHDHSYVEEMVSLGRMKRGSREYLEKKNIITRAVGTDPALDIDFFEEELAPKDLVLLCSDGLTNMVDERQIERLLGSQASLKSKVGSLIAAANAHGGKDNISVVLVDPQISEVEVC